MNKLGVNRRSRMMLLAAGLLTFGCASVTDAQTVVFDGKNLTVNGATVGETRGSDAHISLNAVSGVLHKMPQDGKEGIHGNIEKVYPGTGLSVWVDTEGKAYLFNALLDPSESNHFRGSFNVLGVQVQSGSLITSIKPELLSDGFEFDNDGCSLTAGVWDVRFTFDPASSIIENGWVEEGESTPPPDAVWPDGYRLRSPEQHNICRIFGVASNDQLVMRGGPGATNPIVVNMPANATNVVVYMADARMNGSDRWFPVSWNGYKGYVRQKFVTPQHPLPR